MTSSQNSLRCTLTFISLHEQAQENINQIFLSLNALQFYNIGECKYGGMASI